MRLSLAALDPANAEWQRSVALAQSRLGDLAFKAQDYAEAERRFTQAQAISQALTKTDPGNASRQQDLAGNLDRLGDVALMQGDPVRARDLVRNNCYGSKAIEIFVGNAIGEGISAQARTSSDRLNKQIMEAWNEWCKFCDADGDLDFKGIQALAARSMFESGECFILFRDRGFNTNMRVPLQLQVLE